MGKGDPWNPGKSIPHKKNNDSTVYMYESFILLGLYKYALILRIVFF